MKRKLALLLTVTMLATSVYTPWLANAAEFTSGEENSLYTEEKPETEEIEEEPEADTEEAGEEEVQEDILSDENTDTGEVEEIQPSEEMTEEEETQELLPEPADGEQESAFEDGQTEEAGAGTTGVWNGLNYKVSNGEVTILSVVYDQHFDKDGKKTGEDRCQQTDGKIPSSIAGYPVTEIAGGAYANCINMTEVVIPSTVKRVEREAFSGCTSVRSISLPDNGVTICAGVFQGCTALNSVHIPASVKADGFIGESPAYAGVFARCSALRNVTFGEGITAIPKGFFLSCTGLLSINIPDSVTNIEKNAFNSCVNLKDVHLSAKLESIEAGAFNNCESLSKIQLPSTLKVLRGSAFSGTSLTEINIPPQMKTEDYTAANRAWGGPFAGLTTLKKVTFDQGMEEIPRGIFYSPGSMLMLEEVVLPDSIKKIGYRAFCDCGYLKEITLPKNLEFIDADAFWNCTDLKLSRSELPASLKVINGSAFYGCKNIDRIVFPDGLEFLGGSAFGGCTGLTEINVPAGVDTAYREAGPFVDCSNLKKVTFAKGIDNVPYSIFENCKGLETVEIPDTVKEIESYAFSGCAGLTKVNIPKNVTQIDKDAFLKCSALKEIQLPESLGYMGSEVFKACTALEKITFPSRNIANGTGSNIFAECSSLKNATIPSAVTKLSDELFDGVSENFAIYGYTGSYAESYAKDHSFKFVSVGTTEKLNFKITFNKNAKKAVLSEKQKTKLLKKGEVFGTLPVPVYKGYYFLGWYTRAGKGGTKITSKSLLLLPQDLTLYAHWAKADLTKAKITVGSRTWNGKASLPKVTVKFNGITLKSGKDYKASTKSKEPGTGSVTIKGAGAFAGSKSVKKNFKINKAARTLKVSNVIKGAGNKGKTFTISTKINGGKADKPKITFKSSNSSVAKLNGSKVTFQKTGYSYITVNVGATKHYKAVSKKALAVLQGKQSITLNPDGMKKGTKANTYVTSGELLAKPLRVKALDEAAVTCSVNASGLNGEAWITGGDKLTAKGRGKITIRLTAKESKHHVYPKTTKTITVEVNGFAVYGKEWAYEQNNNGTITLVRYYGKNSKVGIPSSLSIASSARKVTALGAGLFKNNTTITSVSIPSSVNTIGASAFEGCSSLSEVSNSSALKKIGANAFKNCKKLKNIELPETVTSIGAAAFMNCSALTMIRLPYELTTIEANTFSGCTAMGGALYLPLDLETIGDSAFENCRAIGKVHVFGYVTRIGKNAFQGCESLTEAAYAGIKRGWTQSISWGAGNEKLKNASLTSYVYGENFLSSFVKMSEEEFLTDHADYLGNAEISKVAKELQSESYSAMASKSEFDDMAAALISQLEAGTPNVKAIFEHFTGVSYSEDKLNMEMARELLQNMQEEDWNRRYDSLADLLKVINGFFGEAKNIRESFKLDGRTRYQFARTVSSKFLNGAVDASKLNNAFKLFTDNWGKIEKANKAIGKGLDLYDFVISWMLVLHVEYDQIVQLMHLVPTDSGLYTGLNKLEQWYSKDIYSMAVDYIADDILSETADITNDLITKGIVNTVWKGQKLDASSYTLVAKWGFKLVGKAFSGIQPSISAYNKAWITICNTRYLQSQMENLRVKLANGQNDNTNRKYFATAAKAYFASLRQQVEYVSKAVDSKQSSELMFLYRRYEPGLTYNSYIYSQIARYEGI